MVSNCASCSLQNASFGDKRQQGNKHLGSESLCDDLNFFPGKFDSTFEAKLWDASLTFPHKRVEKSFIKTFYELSNESSSSQSVPLVGAARCTEKREEIVEDADERDGRDGRAGEGKEEANGEAGFE